MAHIVLLALAAAVFPTLIACVAIMISRTEPRRLLVAFYAGGVIVSVSAGVVVLSFFNDDSPVVGSTSSNPSPATSIIAGLLSLLFAWLMASSRGQAQSTGGAAATRAVARAPGARAGPRGPSDT